MFKKVLWATDGSEAADRALPLARQLAADGNAELVVFHCKELTLPGKGGGAYPMHVDEPELEQKIRAQVDELTAEGVRASLETARARVGGAAHEVAEAARDHEADVIVVGTRGHTPLAELLLGSVTQRLLHISPCPVLAVPAKRAAART
ncbi:MAG: universal stress protein [Solirubrobacteraceae bacterium]